MIGNKAVELALGTVQFGLPYGIAGRGEAVPEEEVRAILGLASALGIQLLDTAVAYGDIEARLARLVGQHRFSAVTKLPPIPSGISASETAASIRRTLDRSRERLGPMFGRVMFHRAEDLLEANASAAWEACEEYADRHEARFGVSCYDPESLRRISERFPIALAQLPGNALDQRLRHAARVPSVELHLRSVFLQGLLLVPEGTAVERVPAAAPGLKLFHRWRAEHGYSALEAALGIAKGLPSVRYCVVGIDGLEQLEAIGRAWGKVPALTAPHLSVSDNEIIDPRLWKALA